MFCARAELEEGRESLPLLIPVFNEEASELWLTLDNLVKEQRHVPWHTFEVCVALDGWNLASYSMKRYLLQLFPPEKEAASVSESASRASRIIPLDDWSSPLRLGCVRPPGGELRQVTVVVDSVLPSSPKVRAPVPVHHPDRPEEVSGLLYITLVAKLDNRRKHNSHMWFLAPHGFASAIESPLCFLTDCGTLFHERSIVNLIHHMHAHPHAIAVSGIQVQMSARIQGVQEGFFSLPSIQRAVFGFDYLAESAAQSWLHIFGLASVIPGPCGLFRMRFLEGEPLRKYFEVLKQHPHEGDIAAGNMRLVEDRVLTLFGIIYGDIAPEHRGRVQLTRIPSAMFQFPLEDSFQKCLGQRRRWINGTWASNFWVMRNISLIMASCRIGPLAKLALLVFAFGSLLMHLLAFAIPLLFSRRISFLLGSVCESCSSGFLLLTFVCLVIFSLRHSWSPNYWTAGMVYFGVLLAADSVLMVLSRIAQLVHFVLDNPPTVLSSLTFIGVDENSVALGCICFTNILLLVPSQLKGALLGIIPFILFATFSYGILNIYASCLTWDLQWGNRPSNEMDLVTDQHSHRRITRSFRIISSCITFAFLFFQWLLFSSLWVYPSTWDDLQRIHYFLFLLLMLPQFILTFVWALHYQISRLVSFLMLGQNRSWSRWSD